METLLSFLNKVNPLSDSLTNYLTNNLKQQFLDKKDYLLECGQVSRRVCFVQKGLLRCFYLVGNLDVSAWFMKEGDVIFSVESFLTQCPSSQCIQALEDTHVYYIYYNELQYIYRHFPEFNYVGRVLTERYYIQSEQRAYAIRMMRTVERYNNLLKQQPDLVLRVPAKYLASYLGVTEVTLSKIKGM